MDMTKDGVAEQQDERAWGTCVGKREGDDGGEWAAATERRMTKCERERGRFAAEEARMILPESVCSYRDAGTTEL